MTELYLAYCSESLIFKWLTGALISKITVFSGWCISIHMVSEAEYITTNVIHYLLPQVIKLLQLVEFH